MPRVVTERRLNKFREVLSKRQLDLTVVAENIFDPHNLSAILRSCDAVGIMEIHLVYNGITPFPKLGRKSSASAKKWIEINKYTTIEECYYKLREKGFEIYTTHLSKKSISLYDMDLTKPVALVFGNEHSGVSDEAVKLSDGNFLIPQLGMIQSLNISVACAVSLYEALRQRISNGIENNRLLKDAEFDKKLQEWINK
jgi:tRNA (guanosine-2'-O-)-methyltransferase